MIGKMLEDLRDEIESETSFRLETITKMTQKLDELCELAEDENLNI